MVRYIVFDFDGTIADTYHEVKRAVKELRDEESKEVDFGKIRDRGLVHLLSEAEIPLWRIPNFSFAILNALKRKRPIDPFPGVVSELHVLRERYAMGLVSSNSRKNIQGFLAKHELENLFSFIRSDSALFGKHRVLRKLSQELAIPPREMIYIGDENRDIIAARKAGFISGAVSWGYNSESRLRKEAPDLLIHAPHELADSITAFIEK